MKLLDCWSDFQERHQIGITVKSWIDLVIHKQIFWVELGYRRSWKSNIFELAVD